MLTPHDLLESFSTFSFDHSPVVAAVSGGSDSTALLLLLKTYLDGLSSAPRIVAVTVDHGLRPGSADEAETVGTFARGLGIAHRIIRWEGGKPAVGLAATARLARYRLLAGVARDIGARTIFTGHTADDQAETIAMRASRGAGLGLAGMAPATLFDRAAWIVRPLLGLRRNALRDHLAHHLVRWIDDPTNSDAHYERVRIRSELADRADRVGDLLATARQSAARRLRLGVDAACLIREHVRMAAPGLLHIGPEFLAAGQGGAAVHALRILLAVIGGCDHFADEGRTRALFINLARPPYRATLSRVLVASRRDGTWICRETRGLPDPVPAVDGMVWDGRYHLTGMAEDDWFIHWAGNKAAGASVDPSLPPSIAHAADAAQPVFSDRIDLLEGQDRHRKHGDDDHIKTSARGCLITPILPPWRVFLPSFDLAPARAVARLIGANPVPDPPFADHNISSA